MLTVVMTVAMGWWLGEARGDETNRSVCSPTWDVWFIFFSNPCLVKDGKPCADIVIAEKPPRMVKLAARELQADLPRRAAGPAGLGRRGPVLGRLQRAAQGRLLRTGHARRRGGPGHRVGCYRIKRLQ